MIKPKSIIIPVCIGFTLSFVIGLIASVSLGVILLRAIIFATLFGVLGFFVEFIFQRFLLDSGDLEMESSGATKGSIVDLSIGDEPLIEDVNGPDFYVRKDISQQVTKEDGSLNNSSISPDKEVRTEENKSLDVPISEGTSVDFKPISLGSLSASDTSSGMSTSGVGSSEVVSPAIGNNDEVLPEISDIMVPATSSEEEISSGGMDLAIGNGMETSQGRGGADIESDSSTIAQAIRTVLARDS